MPETPEVRHRKKLLALKPGQRIIYNGVVHTVESQTVVHGMLPGQRYRIGLKSDAGTFTMLYIVTGHDTNIRTAWMLSPIEFALSSDMLTGFTWQTRRFAPAQQGRIHHYPRSESHASMYTFVEFHARDNRSPQAIIGEQMPDASQKVFACYRVDPASIRILD